MTGKDLLGRGELIARDVGEQLKEGRMVQREEDSEHFVPCSLRGWIRVDAIFRPAQQMRHSQPAEVE